MVNLKVDVIVLPGDLIVQRAKEVTTAVPIVMASTTHPVEFGLVGSLARPGGNVTGVTRTTGPEIEGKRMELLKEALPKIGPVAFLGMKTDWENAFGQRAQAAARVVGIRLVHVEHTPSQYADAFTRIVRERPDALFVAPNPPSFAQRRLIVEFAMNRRLPGMYPTREFVEAGGLMSYGARLIDLYVARRGMWTRS